MPKKNPEYISKKYQNIYPKITQIYIRKNARKYAK